MITIDDPETERLVREMAARSGRSVEAEVQAAVRMVAARLPAAPGRQAPPEEQARRDAVLRDVARRMDELPDLDTRPADEIVGYDAHGLPA